MKKNQTHLLIFCTVLLFTSCAAPQYIHDTSSYERQKELRANRSGNVFVDIMSGVGSVFVAAMLDCEVDYVPSDQEFKKLKLVNPTNDTLYINMLTDLVWDNENYCDFMDIRIPPKLNCKVMVPMHAAYHLYFSNTPESEDDEMIQIYTTDVKRFTLTPGMTLEADTSTQEK
ncbi:hypothetical protein SLH46_14115 [Draconibacterium sp. IB214405]|uniref:hypothetical protein n=1 Tax=Draconibacterium sp. IB214405 TaxID=3097352 RepID=UPI002A11F96A|nr:hypothetical protein [Draconibacterium sp. IB214405]MDX8340332.1 hypothetical protein [Draconibacterium sp. IB214405]